MRFTSGDVVRRDLVARIVEAYDGANIGDSRPPGKSISKR